MKKLFYSFKNIILNILFFFKNRKFSVRFFFPFFASTLNRHTQNYPPSTKTSARAFGRTDGQTDGQTDGRISATRGRNCTTAVYLNIFKLLDLHGLDRRGIDCDLAAAQAAAFVLAL